MHLWISRFIKWMFSSRNITKKFFLRLKNTRKYWTGEQQILDFLKLPLAWDREIKSKIGWLLGEYRWMHWWVDLGMVRSDTNDGVWKPDRWRCSILPPCANLKLLVSLSNQVKGEKSRHIELQYSLLKNKKRPFFHIVHEGI